MTDLQDRFSKNLVTDRFLLIKIHYQHSYWWFYCYM